MLSNMFLLLGVALVPLVVCLPFSGPYHTYSAPSYQNTLQMSPFYSTRFQTNFQKPLSLVYQKGYPVFQNLHGYYYQIPIYVETDVESQEFPEIDIRNEEISEPVEEDIVDDSEALETHRQKRSPFFFGGRPSSSHATSTSRGTSFSGFGSTFSNTQGSSSASSTGGGAGFGSSNSKAFGGNFGFGSPSFSNSNSNTNAAAISQRFNPWSMFQG